MFFIQGILTEVNIELMGIYKNNVTGHIFNIFNVKKVNIDFLIYDKNNYCLPNENQTNGGGFFRCFNTYEKNFNNLIVSDSFSDKTTIGIKLIDDSDMTLIYQDEILIEPTVISHILIILKSIRQ